MPRIARDAPKAQAVWLLLAAMSVAGCIGSSPDAPFGIEPPHLRLQDGAWAEYRLDPVWPTAIESWRNISVQSTPGGWVVSEHFTYGGAEDMDFSMVHRVDQNGKVLETRQSCYPVFPDAASTRGCLKEIANVFTEPTPFSIFFGTPIALARSTNVSLGVTHGEAAFDVRYRDGDIWRLRAASDDTASMDGSRLKPLDGFNNCDVFTGVVEFDAGIGIPISCHVQEADGDRFGWRLEATNMDGSGVPVVWKGEPRAPIVAPVRMPPADGQSDFFFPLGEAFDAAGVANTTIQAVLHDDSATLHAAVFRLVGRSGTGIAGVAIVEETWEWQLVVRAASGGFRVNVERDTLNRSHTIETRVTGTSERPAGFDGAAWPSMPRLDDMISEALDRGDREFRAMDLVSIRVPGSPVLDGTIRMSFEPAGSVPLLPSRLYDMNGELRVDLAE